MQLLRIKILRFITHRIRVELLNLSVRLNFINFALLN